MDKHTIRVRALAFAAAAFVVAGSTVALGGYSNSKSSQAIAASTRDAAQPVAAKTPLRIEVVGKRATRTAA
ncbi:MAG TPA: hypothetical protein VNE58_04470 [Casimicrobiaceae bacterium]|nr:hypothetical protein [Casimicrobiaceae bacterium]